MPMAPAGIGEPLRSPGGRPGAPARRGYPPSGGPNRAGRRCPRSARDGRLSLALVDALADLLDRLVAERVEIVGLAAGDEAAVDVDLLVDPVPAGVADVGLEARPRGQRPTPDHPGLDQRPRPVADRRH